MQIIPQNLVSYEKSDYLSLKPERPITGPKTRNNEAYWISRAGLGCHHLIYTAAIPPAPLSGHPTPLRYSRMPFGLLCTYSALLYQPSPVGNLIASQHQCAAPPDERDIADVKNTQEATKQQQLAKNFHFQNWSLIDTAVMGFDT